MREKKENQEAKNNNISIEDNVTDTGSVNGGAETNKGSICDTAEMESLKAELEDRNKKIEEYLDKLQRTAAEFDNYKKRTTREKESLYSEAVSDVVSAILPVVDSLERALKASCGDNGLQSLKEGVELVHKQMMASLKSIGVEEINCCEACFDPQLHNAVMHVEDEACGQNMVVEEFQRGYIYKDKVIRHSMVKVAN